MNLGGIKTIVDKWWYSQSLYSIGNFDKEIDRLIFS